MSIPAETVTPALLKKWQVNRDATDKSDCGTVLVIGGARRSPGAAPLAGRASLRVGAGRLTRAADLETADVAVIGPGVDDAEIAGTYQAVVALPGVVAAPDGRSRGTYLQSSGGDRLSAAQGPLSFLAGELLDAMPRVLAELTV